MRVTLDQIRRAAYDRWERRGWNHGGDRDDWHAAETELTFHANYRTIVEYALEGPDRRVLGDGPVRRCRFCERTAGTVDFGPPRPVVADRTFLATGEICGECRSDWRDGLDDGFRDFWLNLKGESPPVAGGHARFSIVAFKSLTASALSIMPGSELRYFGDTLEWVSNPDHESDDQLLDGAGCRNYQAPFLGEPPRVVLARRVDEEAAVPYMLFFLECDGIMVQVPLPMCLRDQDLDGRAIEHPERRPVAGYGAEFREAQSVPLPLSNSRQGAGRPNRRAAIAS